MLASVSNETADCFAVFVNQVCSEKGVELLNGRNGAYAPMVVLCHDVGAAVVVIKLITDVTHDLFKHIFNRNQTGDTAELINDQRKMVPSFLEITQQHIQRLTFRHKTSRTKQ